MTMPIKILTATCGTDFRQPEIIIVGLTDEGAAKALLTRLMYIFEKMETKNKEFWNNDFDRFYQSWNINVTGGQLEP